MYLDDFSRSQHIVDAQEILMVLFSFFVWARGHATHSPEAAGAVVSGE